MDTLKKKDYREHAGEVSVILNTLILSPIKSIRHYSFYCDPITCQPLFMGYHLKTNPLNLVLLSPPYR